MIRINILNDVYDYPENIMLETIAQDFQERFPYRIILARVNGKHKNSTIRL